MILACIRLDRKIFLLGSFINLENARKLVSKERISRSARTSTLTGAESPFALSLDLLEDRP